MTSADQIRSSDLATLRRSKGITLEAIQNATKISLHFLKAIEAKDFKSLPGGVYNFSYLRQYARASGCDEAALIDHYREEMIQDAPEPAPTRPGTKRRFRDRELLRNFIEQFAGRHANRNHA